MVKKKSTTKTPMPLLSDLAEQSGGWLALPTIGSWTSPSAHRFNEDQIAAIRAAELAGRPLLVRGEPGLGKSQIGRALACLTERRLITTVVNARTDIDDLLYSFDHLARLSDANCGKDEGMSEKYIQKGPMWRALSVDPKDYSATDKPSNPEEQGYYEPGVNAGCILLIDEIDKAHPDIPNALLEVLNSGSFEVPVLDRVITGDPQRIFVVISANDEQNLPAAFLRRCAMLELALGENPVHSLVEIAQSHMKAGLLPNLNDKVADKVAGFVINYRNSVPQNEYRPGTSEYLDLLRVISHSTNENGQISGGKDLDEIMEQMGRFLIMKTHRASGSL